MLRNKLHLFLSLACLAICKTLCIRVTLNFVPYLLPLKQKYKSHNNLNSEQVFLFRDCKVVAFQKVDSREESNGVVHSKTTCSWVREKQTGAHQKVQKGERMERRWNAESHKQNMVAGEADYGSRYCRMPLGDERSMKQLDGYFQQNSSALGESDSCL